jgi:hypothetical protein
VSDESMAVGAFGEAARSQRRRQEVAQLGRELARLTRVAPSCPRRDVHNDDRVRLTAAARLT